ncbi:MULTISPECIES: TadE/TadG family type IV pilus assembly protein [unclassified Iodidimonas]|jgi:Flp pilus assembly protein TadG|uniref:TadE/TadG family type IV pilus assembly protein n=1 Tax=unclassified Iodidimonas TaxID=2626145 RepID=UPI002482436B|nr:MULTISPECIES: TadE/TadG family type IV pilus assembly protein [unclassified Iodidimonas]
MHKIWRMKSKQPFSLRAFAQDCGGAAAVEFAVVLPIYLIALFTVIEGGRLVYSQTALYFAVQEATRFAIVREGKVSDSEIRDFTAGRLVGLRGDLAVVTVESPINSTVNTSEYTVNIRYSFTPIFPYIGHETLTLTASSRGFIAFPPVLPQSGTATS